jgi:hypothetical protein
MSVPIFARPQGVFTLTDQAAFIALLDQFSVPYTTWHNSDKKLEKLWKEVVEKDAVYTSGELQGTPGSLVRSIITVSFRAVVVLRNSKSEEERYVLVEFIREGDFYLPRVHPNSSASEKAKLLASGALGELNITTIIRCLSEEIRIAVRAEEIAPDIRFMPWRNAKPLPGGAQDIEQTFREKNIDRHGEIDMPGLWHFNQVAHYNVYRPQRCYFIGWRQDTGTRYLSRWNSTHDTSAQFDPIPAEFVHLLT